MSWSDLFWILLILIVLFGCSTTHSAIQGATVHSQSIIELNTGGAPSRIAKEPHTYRYKTARSARTQQFMLTTVPCPIKRPERAIRLSEDFFKHFSSRVQTFTVHFPLNSWAISSQERKKLDLWLAREHPGEVDVTGYTCWLGSKKYNQWLALKRAKEVASRLRKAGVKVRSVTGRGKCCYIDRKNPGPNRRTDVKVLFRDQPNPGRKEVIGDTE